jgi:hypothetical protein
LKNNQLLITSGRKHVKNLLTFFLLVILVGVVDLGCSKSPSERILGNWKVARMPHEAHFTFTKDSVIFQFEGDVNRDYYKVKSQEEDRLVLETFRPETGQKADVLLRFSGDTLFIEGLPCLKQ